MMVKLSKRLQAVADLAAYAAGSRDGCLCMADVGTDHGYVPVYLVQQGICQEAIAMDVKKEPLLRAQGHIQAQGLEQYIETRLSDGLTKLSPGEVQVIVVAGMGGALMERILTQGERILGKGTLLVLQPQSELMAFRGFLERKKYRLLKEDFVFEDGKYYPMMLVETTGDFFCHWECSPAQLLYGPLLLRQRHPLLLEYLLGQRERKQAIARRLRENASQEVQKRRMDSLMVELNQIEEALGYYEEGDRCFAEKS